MHRNLSSYHIEFVSDYKKKAQSIYTISLTKIFENYEQMLIKICSEILRILITSLTLFVGNDLELS